MALYRGATVADALEVVMRRHPKFAPCLQSADSLPPLFLGGDAAAPDSPLAEGARLRITHYAVTNRIAHVCSTT
ncbi:MAG: hypothetical protein FJ030_02460 [Chloroflexi bacterium]|nr:hypothetical protein [Chloroflexota bacterium]